MSLICLKCVLPECDERDPRCLFQAECRANLPPAKRDPVKIEAAKQANREKYKVWYAANRESKLAQVAQWQRDNGRPK